MQSNTINELTPISVQVPEATKLLGFKDAKSVYALIHAGKLRARKSGRIFLVSYKSLCDYVEAER